MTFRTDRRYYLTADGRAVEEGDPDAQSLLFGVDAEVSAADAKKYNLTDPAKAAEAAPAEPEAEADDGGSKARSAAPANKAKASSESK